MPEIVSGIDTQQKTVTVANNDTAINAELTAQAVDGWLASLFTPSGTDVIILFTRNVAIEAT